MKFIRNRMLAFGASSTVFLMSTMDAANASGTTVTGNVVTSISLLPQLVKALAYLAGLTIGLLGVLKIKDHVENPSNAPLKDGAIRLATGGALLATPTLFDMIISGTTGTGGAGAVVNTMANISFVGGP